MKENAFIICEFNPFHNGHKHLIEETRKAGAENIICIMNGNFVQRGEPAVCSKRARTLMALNGGADLVIELPLKYGISSANYFAFGAISTAAATGLEGCFSFGAEATVPELTKLAGILNNETVTETVTGYSKKYGISYPAAVEFFVKENCSEMLHILKDSNSVLGLEYIKQALLNQYDFDFYSVKRKFGVEHDSEIDINGVASSSKIRMMLETGNIESIREFMPEASFEILKDEFEKGFCTTEKRYFENCIFARLADMKANDFTDINGVGQGLQNRIYDSLKTSGSVEELLSSVKTKRFTYSRMRQIIISAAFGITRSNLDSGINYIRVLGFNSRGRALLAAMRKTAQIPVVTNLSDINEKSGEAALNDRNTDIFSSKIFDLSKCAADTENNEILYKPVIYTEA